MDKKLAYRTNYCKDQSLKRKLIQFAETTFGIPLLQWDRMGMWDPKFRPFSFFDNNKIVSNICTYEVNVVIAGKKKKAAIISTVMTDPAYRHQGLVRDLFEKVHSWCETRYDLCYLFANKTVQKFYQPFGYRMVHEHQFVIKPGDTSKKTGIRKLDMTNKSDLSFLKMMIRQRDILSNKCTVLNDRLSLFHLLIEFKKNIYYIQELDVILVYVVRKGRLTVIDIYGRDIPAFEKIEPYLCRHKISKIVLAFSPDRLKVKGRGQFVPSTASTKCFVRGDFAIVRHKFMFPYTSCA